MKALLVIACAILLSACADTQTYTNARRAFQARVTYYHVGEDKYGSRIASSAHLRAKEGITCAAERTFPFGTKLSIPALNGIVGSGNFEVQDRGRDVQRRRASRGALPVIDVFIATRRKFNWIKNHLSPIMAVNKL